MPRRVLREPLLYLSLYFKQHRDAYYRLLGQVRTSGDWEAWIAFFLEGVRQTAEGAVATRRSGSWRSSAATASASRREAVAPGRC